MLNEREIRERVNRRLSGLHADERRRMRIRAAVQCKKRTYPSFKRALSPAMAFLLLMLLVTASVALAEHFNLFSLWGERDARYARVADQAAQITSSPVTPGNATLPDVSAQIDSAFYDGLTLNLAFTIAQGARYEPYTPGADELSAMTRTDAMPAAIEPGQTAGRDMLERYNQALRDGTPFGYRAYTVYASDHTITDDGIDIPPYTSDGAYTEDGAYHEMREYATPLPDALRGRDELSVRIPLYRSVSTVYFDGEYAYTSTERGDAGAITATISRTAQTVRILTGSGEVNGAVCTVRAEVSPMSAVITLSCEQTLHALFPALPDDAWVELRLTDEQGRIYRAQEACPQDERTEATLSFLGVGELPEALTLHACIALEGANTPEPAWQNGIVLYPDL